MADSDTSSPSLEDSLGSDSLPPGRSSAWGVLGKTVGLFMLVLLAYGPVRHAGFLWDDNLLLWNNRWIKDDSGLHAFWFTFQALDYYPITSTVFWITWRWWGENPLGYHALTLLFHAANAVLVALVLLRLRVRAAWFAALLFGLHPIQVASVAWISELKNTLSMFFLLGSLLGFLRFLDRRSWLAYVASLFGFVLAGLSKATVVGAPIVFLVLSCWKGRARRGVPALAPFFGIAAVLAGITIHVHSGVISDLIEPPPNLAARVAVAGSALWFYLGKFLWPFGLSMVYPQWGFQGESIAELLPAAAFVVLVGGTALYWRVTEARAIFVSAACFVVLVAPALGLIDMSFMMYSYVSDHYVYLASVSAVALAATTWSVVSDRCRLPALLRQGVPILVVLGCAALTWQRAQAFESPSTLWRDTLQKNPEAWVAHYNLGNELVKEADDWEAKARDQLNQNEQVIRDPWLSTIERAEAFQARDPAAAAKEDGIVFAENAKRLYEESLRYHEQAIERKPNYAGAKTNTGRTLMRLGRWDEAIRMLESVLWTHPQHRPARMNLASALQARGDRAMAEGRFADGAQDRARASDLRMPPR